MDSSQEPSTRSQSLLLSLPYLKYFFSIIWGI